MRTEHWWNGTRKNQWGCLEEGKCYPIISKDPHWNTINLMQPKSNSKNSMYSCRSPLTRTVTFTSILWDNMELDHHIFNLYAKRNLEITTKRTQISWNLVSKDITTHPLKALALNMNDIIDSPFKVKVLIASIISKTINFDAIMWKG